MSIEIKGLDEVLKKLENLKNLNTKPLMNSIGNMLRNEIEHSFEDEKSPFGEKWKALSVITQKSKIKNNKSDKILRSSGNLADNWYINATNNKVVVSNNSQGKNGFKYGLTHQFGSNKAGKNKNSLIPAREFLPVDKRN
ncbi:phage virion morphogenesis protein [Campylobacter portucalensis]|uniref:phage virion morphogenesis protein n=1 Tax=Campylobacter portucalensis TaxID=2608384 RepID=UPI001E4CA4B3|nr:phage virion morphogenesis protein [Campylobacter portucalensis]